MQFPVKNYLLFVNLPKIDTVTLPEDMLKTALKLYDLY